MIAAFDFASLSLLALLVPVAVATVILVRLLLLRLLARWRGRLLAMVGDQMGEGALMSYLAARETGCVCCDFVALGLLGIDPKTPRETITPEQRAAVEATAKHVEEAAERLVARGLFAPHEAEFSFRSPEGTLATRRCRTPGWYVLTAAGRKELTRWRLKGPS